MNGSTWTTRRIVGFIVAVLGFGALSAATYEVTGLGAKMAVASAAGAFLGLIMMLSIRRP